MCVYEAVRQILARASMIELRDAMRTADKFGDDVAVRMFRREIERRLGDE